MNEWKLEMKVMSFAIVLWIASWLLVGCTRYEAIDIDLIHIEAHAFSSGYDVKELPVGVADDSEK